ncbi:MAG: hypothetical protein Q8O46_01415 [bacterium]|nr:hypothetical protein [bacterium]
MNLKNHKIQKLISSILIIVTLAPSLIIFATPQKAEAQTGPGVATSDLTGNILKTIGNLFALDTKVTGKSSLILQVREFAKTVLRESLKAAARRALAEMTKSTVNWINSGFHGQPLFLTNPKSFFKDVGETQIKDLVRVIGYDSYRYPFSRYYLTNTIGDYKRTLQDNVQYSFSKITSDRAQLQNYRHNFGTGGWDGFLLSTQYSQNNVFGFELTINDVLSSRIQNETNKVKDTLQEGQGFLSPQTCPSSAIYNNTHNPFKRPELKSGVVWDPSYNNEVISLEVSIQQGDPKVTPKMLADAKTALETYNNSFETKKSLEKTSFEAANFCPGGLEKTTPGAVVAGKIIKAMNNPEEQASLSAALGNSLATIFDSLLNKFIGDGLTSLASSINKQPTPDNFNYYGETLSGASDAGAGWDGLADQEVILGDFKKEVSGKTVLTDAEGVITQEDVGDTTGGAGTGGTYVPGAIANTALEIRLISNDTLNDQDPTNDGQNPGLIQILDSIWPEAKRLDMCIPGPNKDWEKRLEEEKDRLIGTKIIIETSNEDTLKVRASRDAIRELRFAVSSFKDWINTKMMGALPSSLFFIDAIKELDTNDQSYRELNDKLREKRVALARLQSIELVLSPIIVQPPKGSPGERNLISIRKQYNAIAPAIANPVGIEDLRSQLDLAKERKQNLLLLNNQCAQERTTAGWANPGGATSTNNLPSARGFQYYIMIQVKKILIPGSSLTSTGTEKEVFCDVPIVNGYSHGEIIRPDESNKGKTFTFRNELSGDLGTPGYQDLPMVNAFHYYGDYANGFPVSADISCDLLFKTNDNDYKHAGDEQF